MLKLVRKEPDIVLIAPDGQSSYVNRSVAGEALVRFLQEQKQVPSDVTIFHFTKEFLQRFFAADSVTYEIAFREALGMLSESLRERVLREATSTKLLDSVRANQSRASVSFESVDLEERTQDAVHVKAVFVRRTERLSGGGLVSVERVEVELYASIVSRTASHPDGLVIGRFTSRSVSIDALAASAASPKGESEHAR